uniref:Saposin B-type domain-containing protein n=1 Tax=Panagrellus redivivus TaxID=6233 RepID=A0A7E4W9H3_PANRE
MFKSNSTKSSSVQDGPLSQPPRSVMLIIKSQSAPAYGDNICDLCEQFVGALDNKIQSGARTIERQVAGACDEIHPQWLQRYCPSYVDG